MMLFSHLLLLFLHHLEILQCLSTNVFRAHFCQFKEYHVFLSALQALINFATTGLLLFLASFLFLFLIRLFGHYQNHIIIIIGVSIGICANWSHVTAHQTFTTALRSTRMS